METDLLLDVENPVRENQEMSEEQREISDISIDQDGEWGNSTTLTHFYTLLGASTHFYTLLHVAIHFKTLLHKSVHFYTSTHLYTGIYISVHFYTFPRLRILAVPCC